MSFYEDLKDMIENNHAPESWISCAQVEEIRPDTHFVIATTMINTGFMCGGDGCVFGEWAWFNDANEMIDYVTNLVIPMNLCALEDKDPAPAMTGDGDEDIFGLPFSEERVVIKDELQRLWRELRELKSSGADFAKVFAALAESDKRSQEIDGELIFGFMTYDNLRAASEELLRLINNPLDENRKGLLTAMGRGFAGPGDGEFIRKLFINYPIV